MPSPTRFPLGADSMGRAWALNFRTGTVESLSDSTSLVETSNSTLIPFGELSADRLTRILSEGGWSVRVDRERPEILVVQTEIGGVVVAIRDEGRFLRLIRMFGWDIDEEGFATPEDHAEALERLNRSAYVVRFLPCDEPIGIVAFYDLPLTGGVTRAQLLDVLRRYVSELLRVIEMTDTREALL